MTPDTTAASDFDCEAALAQLDDYLKRELTPELADRVRAHVEACAPCFRQMRYAERFLSLLRGPGSELRCPDPLRLRIADALRAEGGDH
ncbi:MAG TPA: zf-HC2 domain-containing protein [Gemmatimonadales bacterium]|nr:zf-HC2 domain-containing protein [Gemmatimonadales bacterium]